MTNKEKLEQWEFKLSAYNLLLSTTYFDTSTIAPKDGNEYRSSRIAYIDGECYSIQTDEKIVELLETMKHEELDEDTTKKVELYLRQVNILRKIPKDFYTEYSKLVMDSEAKWEEAKMAKDYQIFEPYLKRLIEMKRQMIKYRDPNGSYDTLVDDYEPGMTTAKYDEFFDLIKKELLPLIREVSKRQDKVNDDFIYEYYAADKQAQVMAKIKDYLGFDKTWGYMGVSMHPFTSGFSNNDVRVTTAYDEHNISSSIYSIVHEVGHGFYEHQMDPKYDGTILKNVSSGMHESQSRLFENYLGRRKSFVANFYPLLQELFKDNLANVNIDDFVRGINASRPSLIRTDADELTYPIHILIRYEIEKGLMNNTLSSDHLDKTWNEYYKEYLGVDVPSADKGILQDIHWSGGDFGYFATYALGSAIAAQIIHKMNEDFDIDEALASNNFKKITDWLKDHIQHYGARYNMDDILMRATGEKFNPHYYIDYLKAKYTKLYEI